MIKETGPRKQTRRNSQQTSPSKKEVLKPQRLEPTSLGEPWPPADEVNSSAKIEGLRAGVLVGLVLLSSALLMALAAYAFLRQDDRMILEILDFVKIFLSGVGGWAIGRAMK
jgi:hypothetical protein